MLIRSRLVGWWRVKADALGCWVARHMPRWLVLWCFVRVVTHSTSGRYSRTVVSELLCTEALRRWLTDERKEAEHAS